MEKPEKRKDKAVPLVMYKSGERIVIGQALVKGDGSIIAQISKDVRKDLAEFLFTDLGAISVDPKLPVNLKYNQIMTNTEARIAVGLPPKVQE